MNLTFLQYRALSCHAVTKLVKLKVLPRMNSFKSRCTVCIYIFADKQQKVEVHQCNLTADSSVVDLGVFCL